MMHTSTAVNPDQAARIKRADLLSSVGAGVLGAGIALLLAQALSPYAVPILLIGLLSHSWGMAQKHGLEQEKGGVRVWWAETLYWLCWVLMVVVLLVIAVRSLR